MRKVELRPLDTNQPGYGQLVIIGWQGASEGLSVDIQRNQDEYFLQDDGEWRSNAFRFHLPALSPTAEGYLAATVDQRLVDPLLENPHATNMARFYGPDGTQVGMARLRLGQGLLASGASGSASTPAASAALNPPAPPEPPVEAPAPEPEPEPMPEPVSGAPAPEPEPITEAPEPAPTGTSKRGLWILLTVVLLAALIGTAAWFGFYLGDQEDAPGADDVAIEEPLDEPEATPAEASLPEEPTPDETREASTPEEPPAEEVSAASAPETPAPEEPAPIESATAAAPCSLQRMGETGELAFIQGCTGAGNEGGDMLAVITEARDNGHCGIARRLYAHQALNGDAAAALAYAREFDPARHAPSACFPEADAETALFWYETTLGLDPDNAEAGQRLEELQG